MPSSSQVTRRSFNALAGSALAGGAVPVLVTQPTIANPLVREKDGSSPPKDSVGTIKCFCCDFNWVNYQPRRPGGPVPAAAHDWAFVNPKEYFDWHCELGNNVTFCQAFTFGGYAFYPTKLGPVAPGPGAELLPRLMDLSKQAGMPFMSYMSVGADLVMLNHRPHWAIPGSRDFGTWGFLAPESDWTGFLCRHVREFLSMYPVEWMLFDWFVYGSLKPDEAQVKPAPFAEKPFQEIIGRPMPETEQEITPEEHLKYKREVLARQFRAIRDAVKQTSPSTRIGFNVPYWKANEAIWKNHPMVNESDFLFAESTDDVVGWLLEVRKPHQRVMTTIIGRLDGVCDPASWQKWHAKGCDFFGYAFGTPPDFRPLPIYDNDLKIVREAFKSIN